jgi:zinc protease
VLALAASVLAFCAAIAPRADASRKMELALQDDHVLLYRLYYDRERALNQIEASFYDRLERIGGFGGVADQLNDYYVETGNPAYFNEDLSRYTALQPQDIQAVAARLLPLDRRVELIVQPVPAAK